jgi:hypothetical protein
LGNILLEVTDPNYRFLGKAFKSLGAFFKKKNHQNHVRSTPVRQLVAMLRNTDDATKALMGLDSQRVTRF